LFNANGNEKRQEDRNDDRIDKGGTREEEGYR
jgi:hypothetical protein